jgi:hypothetical protein
MAARATLSKVVRSGERNETKRGIGGVFFFFGYCGGAISEKREAPWRLSYR